LSPSRSVETRFLPPCYCPASMSEDQRPNLTPPPESHAHSRCTPLSSASSASFPAPKLPHCSDRAFDAFFNVSLGNGVRGRRGVGSQRQSDRGRRPAVCIENARHEHRPIRKLRACRSGREWLGGEGQVKEQELEVGPGADNVEVGVDPQRGQVTVAVGDRVAQGRHRPVGLGPRLGVALGA
jgi:hypothetical protein